MAKTFFIPIRNLINGLLSLDIDEIAFEISKTNEFKRLVIELNTEGEASSQLYELGEDSTGKSLGKYTPFTISEKRKKGQPTDRVTLKDTGDFYSSFQVLPFKGGFIIDADPIKEDTNLFDRYGEDILGLNDENLQLIIKFYLDAFQFELQKRLKAA
jgi:hypothetical protein